MNIGVWGDSITFGACDKEALGWAGRLRRSMPTDDYNHFYNFGICGETSADVLKRFQVEFDAIEPEKVIFALGINDSKFPHGSDAHLVSLDEYRKNMQELIDRAKETVNEIVLVGPTAVGEEYTTPRVSTFRDAEITKFRDALKEIAEKNNLKFIDMFDVLDPTTDLDDGVHPNTEGYQKMFEAIKSELNWS